jgi:hypothetical protein
VEDDGSLENVVMAAVMGERNTEDSRRKSAAVKAGMDRRRKRGQYIGRLFLGSEWVRNEDDEREIRITESGAAIAQRIFGEYLAGNPQRTIARNCHADKVPTQNGGDWHQATVQKILTNPAYAGLVRDGDKLIEATHEGCIDRKTWNDVQRLLAANTRTHGRGRPVAGLHLFRKGFLRCGACGGPLMPRTLREKRDGRVYESYICYSQERDPNCCSASTIKRTDVDNRVFAYFAQVGLDVDATRDRIASAADRKLREAQALLSGAEDEARAARNRLAKIKRDYTHGDLSAADWRELRAELEPDLEAAKAQAERLRAQVADANKNAAVNDAESAVVERLAAIRVSVAGEVKDAKGAAAVRATLMPSWSGSVG